MSRRSPLGGALALGLLILSASACSGAVAGIGPHGDAGGGGACTSNADCGAGRGCGFAVEGACVAQGTCFDLPGGAPVCQAYSPGCGCDGTEVNLVCNGYPAGYAARPVAHAGACGTDAGGGSCRTSADCGTGLECAFPIAAGCAATGSCVAAGTGPICNSFVPGCACSGATVSIGCNGYPGGYAPEPILHAGICEGIDASTGTFACGTLSCAAGTQVCKVGVGGVAGSPPSYACIALPAQCSSSRTCSCVQPAEGAQLCSADANGDLTITFEYP